MSQAQVVYSNVAPDASVQGQLFDGLKFWVAQRVPTRTTFLDAIRNNGGQTVILEKLADVLIADHLKKDAPPGSVSYTWIEASIRGGELADKDRHLAGPAPGISRPVGSVRPAKTGRNPFSPADDLFLWDWVEDYKRKNRGRLDYVKGNELYKQLEAVNDRHPWQSWRDRYIKYVSQKPPLGRRNGEEPQLPTPPPATQIPTSAEITSHDGHLNVPSTAPPRIRSTQRLSPQPLQRQTVVSPRPRTDPRHTTVREKTPPRVPSQSPAIRPTSLESAQNPRRTQTLTPIQGQRSTLTPKPQSGNHTHTSVVEQGNGDLEDLDLSTFTEEDKEHFLKAAWSIQRIPVGIYDETWISFAEKFPRHTKQEWKDYYELVILPIHKEREDKHSASRRTTDDRKAPNAPPLLHEEGNTPSDSQMRNNPISPPTKRKLNLSGEGATGATPTSQNSSRKRRRLVPLDENDDLSTSRDNQTPLTPSRRPESHKTTFSEVVEVIDLEESDSDDDETTGLANGRGTDVTVKQEVKVYEYDDIPEEDQENIGVRPPTDINHFRSTGQALPAFSEELPAFTLQQQVSDEGEDADESSSESSSEASEEERLEYVPRREIPESVHDDEASIMSDEEEEEEDDQDLFVRDEASEQLLADLHRKVNPLSSSRAEDFGNQYDEPASHERATQAFLASDEIEPDLTITLPPGDFDMVEENRGSLSQVESNHDVEFDTQGFFMSDTQVPDLTIPLPPGYEDQLSEAGESVEPNGLDANEDIRSSPPLESESHSTPTQTQRNLCTDSQLDEFVDHYAALGYSEDDVMYALERTTMNAGLAEKILQAQRDGSDLPQEPGIWTENDDEVLRNPTLEGLEILRQYHGDAALRARQDGEPLWK